MAVLPLPSGHAWKPDGSFTAIIPTAKTPGRVNDASSYEDLWLALALRRGNANVPDVFTRIHQHSPYSLQGSTGRQAAMGYVLTRQIQEATGWDRHDMGSFLVVLAVLIRSRVVTDRTWEQVRGRDILDYRNAHPGADLPDNVWRGLRQFSRHENHRGPTHGISMSPPATPGAPWVVTTSMASARRVSLFRTGPTTGPPLPPRPLKGSNGPHAPPPALSAYCAASASPGPPCFSWPPMRTSLSARAPQTVPCRESLMTTFRGACFTPPRTPPRPRTQTHSCPSCPRRQTTAHQPRRWTSTTPNRRCRAAPPSRPQNERDHRQVAYVRRRQNRSESA